MTFTIALPRAKGPPLKRRSTAWQLFSRWVPISAFHGPPAPYRSLPNRAKLYGAAN